MAKTFTKLGKEIIIAVKAGGPDPHSNSKLRAIIQTAKNENMPKENVERAIKKATSKDQADIKEMVYEGYGPHGVAILVETQTDNTTRTVANVRSYFTKFGGSLGTQGSVAFMFEHKSWFKARMKEGVDLEELELELIDYGVSELFVDEEDGLLNIYGEYESYAGIQKYLEDNGFELVSAEFVRIPTDQKTLADDQVAGVAKLLAKLEEDEDVSAVYHTMANDLPDEE